MTNKSKSLLSLSRNDSSKAREKYERLREVINKLLERTQGFKPGKGFMGAVRSFLSQREGLFDEVEEDVGKVSEELNNVSHPIKEGDVISLSDSIKELVKSFESFIRLEEVKEDLITVEDSELRKVWFNVQEMILDLRKSFDENKTVKERYNFKRRKFNLIFKKSIADLIKKTKKVSKKKDEEGSEDSDVFKNLEAVRVGLEWIKESSEEIQDMKLGEEGVSGLKELHEKLWHIYNRISQVLIALDALNMIDTSGVEFNESFKEVRKEEWDEVIRFYFIKRTCYHILLLFIGNKIKEEEGKIKNFFNGLNESWEGLDDDLKEELRDEEVVKRFIKILPKLQEYDSLKEEVNETMKKFGIGELEEEGKEREVAEEELNYGVEVYMHAAHTGERYGAVKGDDDYVRALKNIKEGERSSNIRSNFELAGELNSVMHAELGGTTKRVEWTKGKVYLRQGRLGQSLKDVLNNVGKSLQDEDAWVLCIGLWSEYNDERRPYLSDSKNPYKDRVSWPIFSIVGSEKKIKEFQKRFREEGYKKVLEEILPEKEFPKVHNEILQHLLYPEEVTEEKEEEVKWGEIKEELKRKYPKKEEQIMEIVEKIELCFGQTLDNDQVIELATVALSSARQLRVLLKMQKEESDEFKGFCVFFKGSFGKIASNVPYVTFRIPNFNKFKEEEVRGVGKRLRNKYNEKVDNGITKDKLLSILVQSDKKGKEYSNVFLYENIAGDGSFRDEKLITLTFEIQKEIASEHFELEIRKLDERQVYLTAEDIKDVLTRKEEPEEEVTDERKVEEEAPEPLLETDAEVEVFPIVPKGEDIKTSSSFFSRSGKRKKGKEEVKKFEYFEAVKLVGEEAGDYEVSFGIRMNKAINTLRTIRFANIVSVYYKGKESDKWKKLDESELRDWTFSFQSAQGSKEKITEITTSLVKKKRLIKVNKQKDSQKYNEKMKNILDSRVMEIKQMINKGPFYKGQLKDLLKLEKINRKRKGIKTVLKNSMKGISHQTSKIRDLFPLAKHSNKGPAWTLVCSFSPPKDKVGKLHISVRTNLINYKTSEREEYTVMKDKNTGREVFDTAYYIVNLIDSENLEKLEETTEALKEGAED